MKKILLRFKLSHKWKMLTVYIGKNGILFLQETHSIISDEGK